MRKSSWEIFLGGADVTTFGSGIYARVKYLEIDIPRDSIWPLLDAGSPAEIFTYIIKAILQLIVQGKAQKCQLYSGLKI